MEEFVWSPAGCNVEFEEHLKDIIWSGELVLDVGCGSSKIASHVVGVDAYAEDADIRAYMWDMPFLDNSVDGLVCMAALEHISKFQVMPTLAEFNRVLKPGAKFAIVVPNLIWVINAFLEKPTVQWEMDTLFGTQTDEGQYHRTGFTRDIIKLYFDEAIPNCEILRIYDVNAYVQMNFGILAVKK